eukprot:3094841-Amphidinium_carterae.1
MLGSIGNTAAAIQARRMTVAAQRLACSCEGRLLQYIDNPRIVNVGPPHLHCFRHWTNHSESSQSSNSGWIASRLIPFRWRRSNSRSALRRKK